MRKAKVAKRRTATRRRPKAAEPATEAAHLAEWPVPGSAALGSSVRLQGIEREIRARLPWASRTALHVENGRVVLAMPEGADAEFAAATGIVAGVMRDVETLPVLPSEAEDILTITAHERQKWLKDGRLRSVGTRTVKLRGRAKAVTFHVFDPRVVEDALDRDLPALWRDEDAAAKAENRRRAAAKAALTRAGNGAAKPPARPAKGGDGPAPRLADWEAFAIDGLLQ